MANQEHPIRNFLGDLIIPTVLQTSEVNMVKNPTTRRRMAAVQRFANAGEVGGATAALLDFRPGISAAVAVASRVTSFVTERVARRMNR